MGRDTLLNRLRKPNPFEVHQILPPRKRITIPGNAPYGQHTYRSICDWIEAALLRYRNRFLTDEALLILLKEGSNTITFMTTKTLEYVDDGVPNTEWDRCLLDEHCDIEIILRNVYSEFSKRHPKWEKTWLFSGEPDPTTTTKKEKSHYLSKPTSSILPPPPAILEIDDNGLCWNFIWEVQN